ncbi:sugar ABC transporter permease [Streptomyces sp. NPDC046900]|uniref:carbohydrate ABC transporter permease n=1 Tax=Streptomyces sp. NPDC046900 TaxID=3155473 RepID=UPI0033C0AD3E
MTVVTERARRGARTATPSRRRGVRRREGIAGWLFVAPAIVLITVFLLVPILMAAWVSVSDWSGQGSPFSGGVHYAGTRNYAALLAQTGLAREDLMLSLRNNIYFVLLVMPSLTALSLVLAVVLKNKRLAARGFFRMAYYFPSVTSSVAISVVFTFMFSGSGMVNALIAYLGVHGPNWFADPDGLVHIILSAAGIPTAPSALADHGMFGLSWWDWLAGPSVAMTAIIILTVWTASGTFMLMFLAALQNISEEIEEAAILDGTTAWQRLRLITLPMLRPTLFLVLTLELIGTWQVFDQIYIISQGNPANTTLTPAYLSYQTSFVNDQWGQGAAISFILFAIIVILTIGQRWLLRDRDTAREKRQQRRYARALTPRTRS